MRRNGCSEIPPHPPLTRGGLTVASLQFSPLSKGADATHSRGGIFRCPITATALLATLLLSACTGLGPRLILDRPAEVSEAGGKPRPATPATASTSSSASPRGGGYYKDDGPGDNPPDLAAIPDADPKGEPLHRFANNPYNVFGIGYTPLRTITPFTQRGLGSWYGRKFHGQKTSSGEVYDMYGMTAAHPTLPIPSYVRVTSIANGKSVIVRVNDRGPFHPGRVIDLSYTAAWKLGYVNAGSTPVDVELLTPELIAALPRRDAQATVVASAPAIAPQNTAPTGAAQVTAVKPVAAPQAVALADASTKPAAVVAQPAQQTATLPVEVQAGGVFLQLGAFSGRDNAESFRARVYRELGWLNDAIDIYQQGGLFRLHLGPYRDRNEAGSMAERIRAALELKPVVVVR